MRGTCIMCPPQKVKGQDKTFLFSFFKDVAQVPQVKEQAVILSQNIHYVLTSITKQVNKWKKYMHRCKFDKDIYMKKSVADLLSHLAYNDKMQLYSNIIQEAEHLPLMNMVLCVQLNMETTVQTFREKAKECIQVLGKQLSISVMEDLHKLEGKLQKLSEKLKIQDKSVLTKKAYSPLIIEKTFEDIREKHRILAVYNINVSEEEKVLCSKLKQLWDALFQDLKNFRKQEEDLPRFTESSKQLDQHREEAVLADPQFISAATGDEEVPMK
ncbi:dynein heavy chain 10, axonemal-like [Polypterus senegalus]|uniref:dynein heavy chain 10, axonemal-like n=1 Tax=Polypterus senegalus TaxID=55291 RepID=UPI001966B2EA|nr:dynein heavy chain 10, axonemal-like [Polypterus senegalus]